VSDSSPATQAEIEHAAAFRAELRRFLSRTESAAAEAGLTSQRYDLVLAIRAAGGASTINELCRQLHMRQTAVTELVKRAEEAGLVTRSQSTSDRRVVIVRNTADAEMRLARCVELLRSEREALSESLGQVIATFESSPDREPLSP
jgi:DNA-binding MarR family transcriptional regulator